MEDPKGIYLVPYRYTYIYMELSISPYIGSLTPRAFVSGIVGAVQFCPGILVHGGKEVGGVFADARDARSEVTHKTSGGKK